MRVIFYIDGVNAYTTCGVFIQQYGYKQIVQMPKLKKVEKVDWPERDGIEVDLSTPALDTKNVTLNFVVTNKDYVHTFLQLISDGAYHTFNFAEIGRVAKLRLISQPSKKIFKRMETFSLTFAEDEPFQNYEYVAPTSLNGYSDYKIDDKDLLHYGIKILKGTEESVMKLPATKVAFVVNQVNKNGAVYAGKILAFKSTEAEEEEEEEEEKERKIDVYFKSKDVILKCLIQADNVQTFWKNYNAFFWDLIQPKERSFYIYRIDTAYPCYYKSSSVTKFDVLPSGRVWCEFSVTLEFTSFRLGIIELLLSAENGDLIITENGLFIEM